MSEWPWVGACAVLVAALAYQWRRIVAFERSLDRLRRDSTRRETELEDSLTRWRDAARALPDGVVILEADRIAWSNDTAQVHLSIGPKDAGTRITHLVRAPDFMRYLDAGEFDKPVQIRAGDGERILSVLVVPYGSNQRLVLSRDVTQLERVERMRSEFVANVSHELRTPLTVVAGFLEMLRDESDAAEQRRYIDLMTQQSQRMQRLVEDLLTLSSLESSPPPPTDEAIDMAALAQRLGAEARALSGGRHRIEVHAASAMDLLGSEKELASAFGNLVSNAVRYTPEHGTIRIRWEADEHGAQFGVDDTGIGIAPEHLPRLTERFYRVDRGRSRETGGTGLGLAIVKHALMRHGGTLHIESKPGEGSRFAARFSGARLRPRG